MVVGIDEIVEILYGMMTARQKEFCLTYFEYAGDRGSIATKLGINKKSVDRYVRGEKEPLIKVVIKLRNLTEIDLKHREQISPEWLESELKQLYDNSKEKAKNSEDEKDKKYYEKMMNEYLGQMKDIEYKFQDMEKDDIAKTLGMNIDQLIDLTKDVLNTLMIYKKKHAWYERH